jgi:choice-of-anchor B domain-containing protein
MYPLNLTIGLLLVLGWAAGSAAQHPPENVTLLRHLDRGEGYSGNWGYTAPNGVELAISGTVSGTSFIDATVPTAAHEVAFIPGPFSTWREMATHGPYCYIVTEAEGAGLQVVDLSDPLAPDLAVTLNPPLLPFSQAHEIKADPLTGYLYVAGTRNGSTPTGLVILDLNVDPLNPSVRGTWEDRYTHDLSIFDGRAYVAAILDGRISVLDVSQPGTPPLLGEWTYPGPLAPHNTWPSVDGSFLVSTDETTGGYLRMWDISDLGAPVQTDFWPSPTGALVHNAYLRGNICYMSHYRDGLRVIDASDPYDLQPLGWYDTHPEDGGGTRGAWGCWCFAADSTIAYITDRDSGTYILRYDPPETSIRDAVAVAGGIPGLGGSFPNPFTRSTSIGVELADRQSVQLRIYDAAGRLVRVLADGPLAGGQHAIGWDGRDAAGVRVRNGVYYYRFETPGFSRTGRVVAAP